MMSSSLWRLRRAPLASVLDKLVPAAAALLAAVCYVLAHSAHPFRPLPDQPTSGWFGWADAGKYLRAAVAWSGFDLRPGEHWYPPGYPMLGALGRALTPGHPFYVPDLVALVGAGWVFALLTAELLDRRPGARALGAAVFAATTVLNTAALDIWVMPWTTTPATLAIYACLLAAMRFAARPAPRTCFWAGFAGGAVALFRPTEAALTLLASGLAMALAALRRRVPLRRFGLAVLAGLAGVALPAAAFLGGEAATGGFRPDGYIAFSRDIGFEWRLIPLHWVGIFGDPRPLWPGERGLVEAFFWIVPGTLGLILAPWCCAGATRANHRLVAGATVLHCAVFLAYRDMHPNQVWWIFLYHYFKWVLPVLGLYAVLLPAWLLGSRRLVALPAAAALLIGLFGWRTELLPTPNAAPPPVPLDGNRLSLPAGLADVRDAVAVPAVADFESLFHHQHAFEVGDRVLRAPFALRTFPRVGGLLLVPLRPLPAGAAVVSFGPGVHLNPDAAPFMARQGLVFGLPCWVASQRPVCHPPPLFPGPVLPVGQEVSFRTSSAYLGGGWSTPEAVGCWTAGSNAELTFRVLDAERRRGVVLELNGRAYAPRGTQPSPVEMSANGRRLAVVRPSPSPAPIRVVIPPEGISPDGQVVLRLRVAEPRRPADFGEGNDRRQLGFLMESMRLSRAD